MSVSILDETVTVRPQISTKPNAMAELNPKELAESI